MPHQTYRVQERWHSQPSKIRIFCVGAGASGLFAAYKIQKELTNFELICFEKNTHIAGTWFENRYPGCACDVPAHVYTYTFEPKPDWSSFYASHKEIRQYFEEFADKYDLRKYIQLNTKVERAVWDEEQGQYLVEVRRGDQVFKETCHILINGTGFLNSWKWPAIPGLHEFEGKLVHSANWDESISWHGKKVALIGTGSSAIQILPQVRKEAQHVTAFMRSCTWISPVVGADVLESDKKQSTDKKESERPDAQYHYTEQEKNRFRDDPAFLLEYRKRLEAKGNLMFELFVKGSEYSKAAKVSMREEMLRRLGTGNEELKARLVPEWSPGCRRLTPGDGYLEALVEPNVRCVHNEIEKVVPKGVVDSSGTLHEVDLLICATGFNLAFAPPFQIIGQGGADMATEFDPEPKVYLGMTVPKFPNYFVVNGVRANWAAGTALVSIEFCVNYIVQCIKRMQEDDIKAMEVGMKHVESLYEHMDEWHKRSVFSEDCKSWYKNNVVGGKVWVWAGSSMHYHMTISKVRWEHYDIRYKTDNEWSFLGNGLTEAQVIKDLARLTPYIRNADVPFEF